MFHPSTFYPVSRLRRCTALPWSMHPAENCKPSSSYRRISGYLKNGDGRIYGSWSPLCTTCTKGESPIGKSVAPNWGKVAMRVWRGLCFCIVDETRKDFEVDNKRMILWGR
ncbi:hypothetical protein ElyMa_005310900 [Elysia marginata]|uniref:Uncharacterized protein n=1 Tax=Elysia marginata TaxID=1093978 RepID=A0AAV4JYG8_9GAST|nr:hypothetical protein ElyMa_005310900 [Elysia marginata]